MSTAVKVIIVIVGYVILRQFLPDTFQFGFIAGATGMALLCLVNHFAAGWNRAKLRPETKQ